MLWGNLDHASGNQKPKFANTSNVFGVTATEKANTTGQSSSNVTGQGPKIIHTGWVQHRVGTGPVKAIGISTLGVGVNSAGYISFSGGGGTGANASYTIANVMNVMESFSSNSRWNVVNTITLVSGGSDYNATPTATVAGINTTSFLVEMGGRCGRSVSETLVAMNTITGDSSVDNVFFTGI